MYVLKKNKESRAVSSGCGYIYMYDGGGGYYCLRKSSLASQ
jgi:hypothetical protein